MKLIETISDSREINEPRSVRELSQRGLNNGDTNCTSKKVDKTVGSKSPKIKKALLSSPFIKGFPYFVNAGSGTSLEKLDDTPSVRSQLYVHAGKQRPKDEKLNFSEDTLPNYMEYSIETSERNIKSKRSVRFFYAYKIMQTGFG